MENVIKYKNVDWTLPLLFSFDAYIIAMSKVAKELKIKNPITFAYGMMPTKWTGGRISKYRTQDKKAIEKHLKKVIEAGTTPLFTFSKYFIEKEDLNDEFANWLLDFGYEHNCQFIISSDLLYDHIKSKYPDAKCIASVLKFVFELEKVLETGETEFYNSLIDKYERIVLRPEYSRRRLLKHLNDIKDLSKVEVLINQVCINNCKEAIREHSNIPISDYDENAKSQVGVFCPFEAYRRKNGLEKAFLVGNCYEKSEVDAMVENGVRHLKLQGRNYEKNSIFGMIGGHLFDSVGAYSEISSYMLDMINNDKKILKDLIITPRKN
ncbi:MAG: hypothetical protein MJ229_00520 [bacterium]|nr:hypothetical protein [bacterium]